MQIRESKAVASSFGSPTIKEKATASGFLKVVVSRGKPQLRVLEAPASERDLTCEIVIFGPFFLGFFVPINRLSLGFLGGEITTCVRS